ncbi:MAG: chromosomal replication initiator protein DnaA [Candidatus Omnitrophica bacterium]|nr:chromosomal replication initiator protein DnaA [Candidatus Omnitrophota bacterium]
MEKSEGASSLSLSQPKGPENEGAVFESWQKILSLIQKELSERSFQTWFGGLRCLGLTLQEVTLGVPDSFYGNWLQEHYHDLIRSSAQEVLGVRPEVIYRVVSPPQNTVSPKPVDARPTLEAKDLGLNPNYVFENFVVGPGSRFAYAAACAVTDEPAKHYNPLFIYGRVGLGKTHLMQSIALETKRRSPEKKILYISSEKFTNQLIAAIQGRSTHQFRTRFRGLDLLLIDDIHFISGKEATQEEFFHTFNTLYDAHKQIVMSSDRSPRDIPGLEERLVSRFAWGLVTDIQPPDFETRVAILRKKLEKHSVRVSDEVLFYIAERIQSNVRELEGALVRLIAFASLNNIAIDLFLAERVLGDSFKEEGQKVGIEEIQRKVAEFFGLRVGDLRAHRWTKPIAQARRVAMYLVREVTRSPLGEIGEYFGGRDPATVFRACKQVESQLVSDERIKSILTAIKGSFCQD